MAHNNKYKIWIIALATIAAIEAMVIFNLLSQPKKKPVRRLRQAAPVVEKGRIAIVIDDWGNSLNNVPLLRQVRYPLTLAVLPNLPYSAKVNQDAHAMGFEVILHFPMEPYEKSHLEKNTVMVGMDEPAIKRILASDLNSISFARSVSNQMGSAAISDTRTMSIILGELKRRGLYFLDSYVTKESVAFSLATAMKVGFARRNVFLDNIEDANYIKNQILQLKMKADAYGRAIGIGHDRRLTMQVLKEVMPQLEKEGYRFVFVSELVK